MKAQYFIKFFDQLVFNVPYLCFLFSKVGIAGSDDKRQITGTYFVSMKGDFLPPQLIYQGKTSLCHPRGITWPKGFHVTHSENHWSNETVHIDYLKKTIIPHITSLRQKLNLSPGHKALLVYDVFKGQTTGAVNQILEENNILSVKVPANHTNLFQPLDLTVNKCSKAFFSDKYQTWYAEQVAKQISRGVSPHDVKVDIRLFALKPLHAKWIVDYYNHMSKQDNRQIVVNGFKKAGIIEAYEQAKKLKELVDNPFLDIDIDTEH